MADFSDNDNDSSGSPKTELRDHDVPKRDPSDFEGDPRHDALISNPDLREAYTELKEEGHTTDEAHYLARKEVFGDDWEPDFPERYDVLDDPDLIETEGTTKSQSNPFDQVECDYEERGSSVSGEDEEKKPDENTTITDWGDQ